MPIDTLTDERFSLFTGDERAFLQRVFASHAKVEENFDRYLSLPPDARYAEAIADLKKLKRTGWVKRGIPNPESVFDHIESMLNFVRQNPQADFPSDHIEKLVAVHDTPEAIITDFIPGDGVLPQDKAKLEELAIKVIMEGQPERVEALRLIKEFNEQRTPESQWVHDVDKMDPVRTALFYEAKHPHKMGVYKEFLDYAKARLKTDKGKAIIAELEVNADKIRQTFRENVLRDNGGNRSV